MDSRSLDLVETDEMQDVSGWMSKTDVAMATQIWVNFYFSLGPTATDSDWSDIPSLQNERKLTKEKRKTKCKIPKKIIICAK